MAQKVLITGASGLVGKAIIPVLLNKGYEIVSLSRIKKSPCHGVETFLWDIKSDYIDKQALVGIDFVIHLAGAGIADEKWTDKRKKELYNSRVKGTKLLFKYISDLPRKPKAMIAASGIAIYGIDSGDLLMTEKFDQAQDFLANLTRDWETEILKFKSIETRTVVLRTGIVLSNNGGAFPKLLKPILYNVGAPLGTGQQFMSWIHIKDIVRLYVYALEENDVEGKFNAVSSSPVTNEEFTAQTAHVFGKKLFLPNVPAFAMKLLLGEMSTIVLGGNKVSNQKIIEKGFDFKFTDLDHALLDLKA